LGLLVEQVMQHDICRVVVDKEQTKKAFPTHTVYYMVAYASSDTLGHF